MGRVIKLITVPLPVWIFLFWKATPLFSNMGEYKNGLCYGLHYFTEIRCNYKT